MKPHFPHEKFRSHRREINANAHSFSLSLSHIVIIITYCINILSIRRSLLRLLHTFRPAFRDLIMLLQTNRHQTQPEILPLLNYYNSQHNATVSNHRNLVHSHRIQTQRGICCQTKRKNLFFMEGKNRCRLARKMGGNNEKKKRCKINLNSLDDVKVSGTNCIVKCGDSFIVCCTRIRHL